jgi:hypothetical protein
MFELMLLNYINNKEVFILKKKIEKYSKKNRFSLDFCEIKRYIIGVFESSLKFSRFNSIKKN